MTTFFDFRPSTQSVFQFQPTLDGDTYNCTVTWNLFGQRYYVNCFSLDGTLIFSLPIIGSPGGKNIETCSWDSGEVTVITTLPHGYRLGSTVRITISQCSPDTYNGDFEVLVASRNTLTYARTTDPGLCTAPGLVLYNINMGAAYFQTSKLVFRTGSSQFEVMP